MLNDSIILFLSQHALKQRWARITEVGKMAVFTRCDPLRTCEKIQFNEYDKRVYSLFNFIVAKRIAIRSDAITFSVLL